MYCVYLVTEKTTKEKTLHIVEGEKSIFIEVSPRTNFIELLEKHSELYKVKERIEPLRNLYNCKAKIALCISESFKKTRNPNKSYKPGPKPGTKYNITEEDRERRKKQFSKGIHPNSKGFSEEHRAKLSAVKKNKPSNFTGKKHSEQTKLLMAEKKKGNQHRKGWIVIYHPVTGEERVIKDTDKLPEGFRYGKPKSAADNFDKY